MTFHQSGFDVRREWGERGFERDSELASETDISDCVPILAHNAYINQSF